MNQYSDDVQDEKIKNLKAASDSHHRRIGLLEVKMSDVEAGLAAGKEARIAMEDDIKDAKRASVSAKKEASKAAGAVSERFDKLATSFRNWTLFIVTVAGVIFAIVKGITG